jgi:hypothetical protein
LVPPDYLAFLKAAGEEDNDDARMRWAAGYAQKYKLHERAPMTTGLAPKTIQARTTFHKRRETRE